MMFLLTPILMAVRGGGGDADLVLRLQRRDSQALAELYDRYGRMVYGLIRRSRVRRFRGRRRGILLDDRPCLAEIAGFGRVGGIGVEGPLGRRPFGRRPSS